MKIGETAYLVYVGSEAGSNIVFSEVTVMERLPKSWRIQFKGERLGRIVSDRARDIKLFPTKAAAKDWLHDILAARVAAAEVVLHNRTRMLASWDAYLSEDTDHPATVTRMTATMERYWRGV